MRWAMRKYPDYSQWHPWFAWRPVLAGSQWVWLERVWRKEWSGYMDSGFDYRPWQPDKPAEPA